MHVHVLIENCPYPLFYYVNHIPAAYMRAFETELAACEEQTVSSQKKGLP